MLAKWDLEHFYDDPNSLPVRPYPQRGRMISGTQGSPKQVSTASYPTIPPSYEMPTLMNEAFSSTAIDALLKDVGWNLSDGRSVRFEYVLPDSTRADYVLCDRHGCSLAVLEAKEPVAEWGTSA